MRVAIPPLSAAAVRLENSRQSPRREEEEHDGTHRGERRPAQVLLLRKEPEAGPAAHRRSRRLHLRRVRRALQRDHRGAPGRGRRTRSSREFDLPKPREIFAFLEEYVIGQEPAKRALVRRRLQPLQARPRPRHAHGRPTPRRRRRDRQVQHPADRPDRLRQDLPRPDPGEAAQRAVRRRRRHGAHRGRLRRRRRREHPAEAHPGRRLRRRSAPRPASSTSTRSTRSPARPRTRRSRATCPARACSRRC